MLTCADADNLLDTHAAAQRVGVAYHHFVRLRSRGQTPPPDAFQGRQARYRAETLDRWLAERGGKRSWRLVPSPVTEVDADDSGEQAAA